MNPFNNRWLALFVIVGLLLVVAELVGTGDRGGVLSQVAQSRSDGGSVEESGESPPEVITEPPKASEEVSEDVPEEDLPQVVAEDDVDDASDLSAVDDVPEDEVVEDAPVEDDSGGD